MFHSWFNSASFHSIAAPATCCGHQRRPGWNCVYISEACTFILSSCLLKCMWFRVGQWPWGSVPIATLPNNDLKQLVAWRRYWVNMPGWSCWCSISHLQFLSSRFDWTEVLFFLPPKTPSPAFNLTYIRSHYKLSTHKANAVLPVRIQVLFLSRSMSLSTTNTLNPYPNGRPNLKAGVESLLLNPCNWS